MLLHVFKTSQFPSVSGGIGQPGEPMPSPASNKPPAAGCRAKNFWFPADTLPHHAHTVTRLLTKHSYPTFQKWASKSRVCLAELIPVLCVL